MRYRRVTMQRRRCAGKNVDLANSAQIRRQNAFGQFIALCILVMYFFMVAGVNIGIAYAKQLCRLQYDVGHIVDRIDYLAVFVTCAADR